MRWSYLGRVEYDRALTLQRRIKQGILQGLMEDTLLLLEHPPVITLGRSAKRRNVLLDEAELTRRGVELAQVDRGGDVTFHGPGQLVGYPVRRVERRVQQHVRGMADALVALLERRGLEAWWQQNVPGVWTAAGKVAAVGVDARGGVAMHGFALNVGVDLRQFQMIVPCGLQAPVTSLEALLAWRGASAPPESLPALARELALDLAARYGSKPVELDADEPLRVLSRPAEGLEEVE